MDSPSRVKSARDSDVSVGSAIADYQLKYTENPAKLAQLRRIYPSLCGFDTTYLVAVALIIRRIKEFPGIWEAVGEVMSRHDHLTTGKHPPGSIIPH